MDKRIILDGQEMINKKRLHDYLKEQLDLPNYYGRNLDALKDCLTTDFTPQTIEIIDAGFIEEHLGRYGKSLLRVFLDAAKENDHLEVHIKNDSEQC
ncbi:barstar family protein [Desemzia sp. RIT804]|uniref:barstar family protein n=1 Tax=Desemzia sp. RIT 804 TaxID=2810209 RepID=UPI00195093AC|nr:barstar family protein [Desemzia sp. RIT 804]MBM6616034.1 barstar family protein [Desemzia sp. RIT 804]